jgi:hypothetical protein
MADEPVPSGPITLDSHEAASQARFETLAKKLKKLKESNMADTPDVNIYQKDPMAGIVPLLMGNTGTSGAGAIGGGLGAGLLGGILGGALLNNRGGLFGNNGDGGAAASTLVLENAIAANERLNMARFDADAQRDLQASIERTAAATQLALAVGNSALGVEIAKGQGEINTQVALTTGNLNTQGALNAAALGVQVAKTTGDLGLMLSTQGAALSVQAEKTAAANALATAMALKDALITNNAQFASAQLTAMQNANVAAAQLAQVKYDLAKAIADDGEETRELITANNDAELNRRLVTAQNEIIELRGDRNFDRRSRETEINVTQNVNQQQVQLQQQQQQQTQLNLLSQIAMGLGNLTQIAHATNNSIIAGNTGAVVGGAQTANPTNIRT